MRGNDKQKLLPRMRFPEFHIDGEWKKEKLAKFLVESRIEGSTGDTAKKITVKLWGKGVLAKEESIKGSENTKYYKRRAGQFIYSKLDFLNQAFGIVPKELDGFESTVDLPCFDIDDELNAIFLLEYVKRNDFYKKNGEIADGGRKAKRIQTDIFLSFPIILPPYKAEQQKIADCLFSLDELLAAEFLRLDALKKYKQGLLQKLFPREGESVPRLRFPEFQNEREWVYEKIGDCLEKVIDYRGKAPPKAKSGVQLITAKNVRFGWLDMSCNEYISADEYESWMSKGIPMGGDILFTTEAPLGNVAMFPGTGKFALGQRIITLRTKTKKCLPEFLFQVLLSPEMQRMIDFHSTGSTAKGIKSTVFVNLSFCYPRISEQQRIAEVLSSLDDLIAAQSQKLDVLKNHKKGLTKQLFPDFDEISL